MRQAHREAATAGGKHSSSRAGSVLHLLRMDLLIGPGADSAQGQLSSPGSLVVEKHSLFMWLVWRPPAPAARQGVIH